MENEKLLTAIDVGTSKVCTIVGRKTGPREFEVLAHSVVPCDGLKKGNVADISSTGKAIRASIEEVEQRSGVHVRSAYVGVTGAHIAFENRWQPMEWAGQRGVVTVDDLSRVPAAVAASGTPEDRKLLHIIPMSYSVDGQRGIRNPQGMHSRSLEVETHVVTGGSSFVEQLVKAVESSGIVVEELVLEPLASSEAVLTGEEREEGVALVDVGGGTTDVVVFKNGSISYTAAIPVGGYQFTNDISVTYNTSYAVAEAAKLVYAHTEPYAVRPQEEVSLEVIGRSLPLKVPRRDICQLTRERAQELVRLIMLRLQEAQVEDTSNVRLVITGGTSNLPGLQEFMRRTLTNHVRIGVPDGLGSIPADLKAPAFSTGVGIFLWALDNQGRAPSRATNGRSPVETEGGARLVTRFFKQVRNLFRVDIFSAKQGRI